jgi:hypothetical protein
VFEGVLFLVDKGCQSILALYLNSEISIKCKRNQKLSKEEKIC